LLGDANTFPRKLLAYENERFCLRGPCRGVKKEDSWGNQVSSVLEFVKKRDSWKGAAVQRGLEPRGSGIAIVRSHYKAATSED
jgi:hypothetical protein